MTAIPPARRTTGASRAAAPTIGAITDPPSKRFADAGKVGFAAGLGLGALERA